MLLINDDDNDDETLSTFHISASLQVLNTIIMHSLFLAKMCFILCCCISNWGQLARSSLRVKWPLKWRWQWQCVLFYQLTSWHIMYRKLLCWYSPVFCFLFLFIFLLGIMLLLSLTAYILNNSSAVHLDLRTLRGSHNLLVRCNHRHAGLITKSAQNCLLPALRYCFVC